MKPVHFQTESAMNIHFVTYLAFGVLLTLGILGLTALIHFGMY